MSDDATAPATKRGGRKAPAPVTEKAEKVEAKKRPRKEIKPADSGDEDGADAPKRGRGRPKGSTKKKAAPKAKGATGGRRGRPKKDEKAKSSEEEENDEEEDDAEEEDDE